MDERLRGKGDFSVEEIMAFSARKDDWIDLEQKLNEDYLLEKIIIKDSPSQGWGINYRVGKNSLCYVHPEKTSLFVAFQITEAKMNEIKPFLSEYAWKVWENRYPCGKGGWMWYRLTDTKQIAELRLLLNNKKKPTKK